MYAPSVHCSTIYKVKAYGLRRCCTYNGLLLSHQKEWIMPSAAIQMDLDYHTKSDRERQIWYHLYVEYKKKIQMNLFTGQKQTHRLRKQIFGFQKETTRAG